MTSPTHRDIDHARQAADVDSTAVHHRVRHAELLRRAGRVDEAADAYRVAARACTVQGDWYRAFALARVVAFLDPGDTEIQRYVTSAYSRREDQAATGSTTTDTGEFPLVSGVREGIVPAALSSCQRQPLETSRFRHLVAQDVLSDLEEPFLQEISHLLCTVVVTRGEAIFREGETSTGMFLILRGEAEVQVVDDAGQLRVLIRLGAGDFFGEFSLMGVPVRSALVEAASRLELLDIDVQLFELLTEASARFGDAIRNAWRRREA